MTSSISVAMGAMRETGFLEILVQRHIAQLGDTHVGDLVPKAF